MNSANSRTIHKPVIEHVHELQRRLMWIVFFVGACSAGAYAVHQHLLVLLQKPLGENLYYTSPAGGLTFLFKLCITAGLIMALPAIIYNILKFFRPALDPHQQDGLFKYTVWSFILASAGVAFAYFLSLPAALHFLMQFGNDSIQSLINVNEYFNFAIAYVGGFACLFQLPLVVLFINRVKPLTPRKMMSAQRYVVVGSFIIAALLTPTPDPLNQAMMAAPMIVLYQFSILMVWRIARKRPLAPDQQIAIPDAVWLNFDEAEQEEVVVSRTHSTKELNVNLTPSHSAPKMIDVIVPGARIQPARPVTRRPVQPIRPNILTTRRAMVGNEFVM